MFNPGNHLFSSLSYEQSPLPGEMHLFITLWLFSWLENVPVDTDLWGWCQSNPPWVEIRVWEMELSLMITNYNSQSVHPLEWVTYSESGHHSSDTNHGWSSSLTLQNCLERGCLGFWKMSWPVLKCEEGPSVCSRFCSFQIHLSPDFFCETVGLGLVWIPWPNPHLVKSERAPCISRDLHPLCL